MPQLSPKLVCLGRLLQDHGAQGSRHAGFQETRQWCQLELAILTLKENASAGQRSKNAIKRWSVGRRSSGHFRYGPRRGGHQVREAEVGGNVKKLRYLVTADHVVQLGG